MINGSEIAHAASGPWGRSALTALLIFVALWFDPRISQMQREIAANHEQINSVDTLGTRKSQQEFEGTVGKIAENTRRIQALEERSNHIDQTLTAILNKLSEPRR